MALPTLQAGHCSDLKVDDGRYRVWLSRMDMTDGEPYDNTVYVEELHRGAWQELGHYDGDNPVECLPGITGWYFLEVRVDARRLMEGRK